MCVCVCVCVCVSGHAGVGGDGVEGKIMRYISKCSLSLLNATNMEGNVM